MFLTHSLPIFLPHRRILCLYAMDTLAVKRLVPIHMSTDKISSCKEPDTQKRQTYCNY